MRNMTNICSALDGTLAMKNSRLIAVLLPILLCLTGASLTVIASPSSLDPSFGVLGKVVSSPDGSEQLGGRDMALQPDGKIVMIGNRVQSGQYVGFVIARYNADGSLDTGFGQNGWTPIAFGGTWEYGSEIATQPDGKIVIGGVTRHDVGNIPVYEFAIGRLNSDGSLDSNFDGDGKLIIPFIDVVVVTGLDLGALKIAGDGKIFIAGTAINGGFNDRFVSAKINADGSPVTSYGTNGRFVDQSNGSSNFDTLTDMVILPDGTFVVVGYLINFKNVAGIAIKYGINGGRLWTYTRGFPTWPTQTEALNGIALQPDGRFVVVGKSAGKIIATRLNADGTVDASFVNPTPMPNGQAISVAVQTDGKIVANVKVEGGSSSFSLVRFNANGSLDSGFGSGGFANTNVTTGSDGGVRVIIQPDGKILVGGASGLSSPARTYFSMVRYLGTFTVPYRTLFDFDGDGKSDFTVFRPSTNVWYELFSSNQQVGQFEFGVAGDIPAPADYDGDGKTDEAIFRPSSGTWWYQSSINNAQLAVQFGAAGDVPRPSDFDGDGKDDFVLYRPSNSTWYRLGSTGAVSVKQFGIAEDKPVIGDFDGDGKSDLAIYRPSTGTWWYAASGSNEQFRAVRWGAASDIPAPADFDGDGKTDLAVFRPSEGGWYVLRSSNGTYISTQFGVAEDRPIPADYDGDGKADIAVFRPSTGVWYLLQSTAGFGAVQWGVSTDVAIPNAFVP